jgi:ATP-dependent DNA helicase RecQ
VPRTLDAVAREAFGFKSLRPEQRRAIEAVVEGRDTLVVMPTGAGKSAPSGAGERCSATRATR